MVKNNSASFIKGSNLDLFDTVDQQVDKQSTSSDSNGNFSATPISQSKSYSSSTLDVLNSLIDFESGKNQNTIPNLKKNKNKINQNTNSNNDDEEQQIEDEDDIDSLILDIDSLVTNLDDIEKDLKNSRKHLTSLTLPRGYDLSKHQNDSPLTSVIHFTIPNFKLIHKELLDSTTSTTTNNNNSNSNEVKKKDHVMDEINDLIKLSESSLDLLPSPKISSVESKYSSNSLDEFEISPQQPPIPSLPSSGPTTPLDSPNLQSTPIPLSPSNNNTTTCTSSSGGSSSVSNSATWTKAVTRKSTMVNNNNNLNSSQSISPLPESPPLSSSTSTDSDSGHSSPVFKSRVHTWRKSNASSHPRSSTDPFANSFDRKSIINLEQPSLTSSSSSSGKHRSTFPGALDDIQKSPTHSDGSHIISSPILTKSPFLHNFPTIAPILTFDCNGMEYSILDPKKQKIDLENYSKINRLIDLLRNYRNKIISLINKISKDNEDILKLKHNLILKYEKRNKFYRVDHQFKLSELYREYYAIKLTAMDTNTNIGKERIEFMKSKLIVIGNLIDLLKNYDKDKSPNVVVYSSFFLKKNELLNSNVSIFNNIRRFKSFLSREKKLKLIFQNFKDNFYNSDSHEKREKRLKDIISRGVVHPEFKHYYPWHSNFEIQSELSTLLWDSRFKEGKQIHELINILSDDCTGEKNIKPIDIELFIEKFCEKLILNYNLLNINNNNSNNLINNSNSNSNNNNNNTLKKSSNNAFVNINNSNCTIGNGNGGSSISNITNSITSTSVGSCNDSSILSQTSSIFNNYNGEQLDHQTEKNPLSNSISMLPTPPLNNPLSFSGNNSVLQVVVVDEETHHRNLCNILSQLFKRIFYPEIYHLMKIIISKEVGGNVLKYDMNLCNKVSNSKNFNLNELNLLPNNFPTNLNHSKIIEYFKPCISYINELHFHVVPIDLVYTIQQTLSSIYSTSIEILKKDKKKTVQLQLLQLQQQQQSSYSPYSSPSKSSKSFRIDSNNAKLKSGSFIGKDQHLSFETKKEQELLLIQQAQEKISLSADDLFPLLIYVLMNSEVIGYSKTIVSLIEQFSSDLETNGEFGWCSVSFQAAISHLDQL